MEKHENFLSFNGINLIFINVDGIEYIALRPILDALGIPADSTLKRTKRDRFLGGYTSIVNVQVGKNGEKQGRNMICLPEKYIYGWIGHLNGSSKELAAYKETCYELLYTHFKGTIGNRNNLVLEKSMLDKKIKDLKNTIREEDPIYKELSALEAEKKKIEAKLKVIDLNIVNSNQLFPE